MLNLGSYMDNLKELFDKYKNFDIIVMCCECGIKFELVNFFEYVFVDG